MKKLIAFLFAALFAAGAWAHQYEATVNGVTWYYNRISDGKGGYNAEITYRGSSSYSYDNEYSGSLTIPSTLGGYKVKTIGINAFYSCSSLTSVKIPNSVTSIGEDAFQYCSSLTSVTIPNSVTTIGYGAFDGCSSLTSVTIPNSVTSIESAAFSGCSSLTSITIPDSVTTIGSYAFLGCSSLISITIPNSVTSIGEYAFYYCSSLTSVTIPDSVTEIGSSAFYGCSSLTSVTIPDSVTEIGYRAFEGTPFYNNQPDGLVILGNGYLYEYKGTCSSSVTIPDSVTTIGNYAFYSCSSLTSVTIPNSVTTIGNYAFYSCSSLTSVTIPNSVTEIGALAFSSCGNLQSFAVDPLNKNYASIDGLLCTKDGTEVIAYIYGVATVPDGVTTIGKNAFRGCSSLTSVTIPNSVTSIGESAFSGCSSLVSVTIPGRFRLKTLFPDAYITSVAIADGVTEIGEDAFYECRSLTSVTIPDSVTTIGNFAFYSCSSLTSVTIPNSVTSIGDFAFGHCSSLTSVTIPDSVTSIGGFAFGDCSSLKEIIGWRPGCQNNVERIVISDSVKTIGEYAFDGCSLLTSVTIPNSVKSIGGYAFRGCSSLTSVTIPDGVTSIGDETFYGCSSLTSVTIPNSVTTIGEYAFRGCSSLTSVTIPDSVTTIGEGAFRYCNSLTSITIPDSVTTIWSYAFGYCSSLTSITIPDSVTTIGNFAFYSCSSLTSVTIPNSVTTIWDRAFFGCSSLISVELPGRFQLSKAFPSAYDKIESVVVSDGVTTIGSETFRGCSSLTSVTIPDSVTLIESSAFSNCSSLTSVTIPDSVTTIGEFAFYNCSSLKSFIVGENNSIYRSINGLICSKNGKEIIFGVNGDVTIPDGVTEIGSSAFYGCSSLTSVTIPNSVTSIGSYAFRDCSSLTSVTIPNSVTSIGSYAFYNCSSLTSVTIPNGVTKIGEYAFYWCSSLKTVYVDSEDANRVKELMRGKGVGVDALTFVEPPKATITPISGTTFEASLSISITCDSESATIYYTTDGSEPTMKSTQYTKRFRINGKTTIKARAFFDDGRSSNVVTAEYALGQCPDPVVSTTGGETFYHKGNQVSIVYDCEEGVVRYTTDGSEPTKDSPIYTAPFTTDESMVVKAKAFSDNYFDSEVVTATLTREWEPVATPVISAAESFTGSKTKVELTCATEGAIIHYTVDGCEPNSHSKRYLGPFEVRETTTVKAYAILSDYTDSEVAAKTITKNWGIGDSVGLPDHKFTTEGVSGWVDDRGVMKSGAILHNETSILKSTFVGKGKLAFEIKLACEEDDPEYMEFDHYELWIDGAMAYKMDGVHDWTACSYDLSEGAHEIEWRYVKDEQDDPSTPNPDGVWLRNIVWSPEKTQASEVKVELAWLKTYFPSLSSYYFDYEEKADETAANGLKVWEAYLIGLDPTDSAAKFVSSITIEDGKPVVSWDPDLGGARAYTILGSTDLKTWTKVEEGRASDYNFFKVSVEMK